jgi:DNA-directed RNA polymerase subunit L
MFSDYKDFGPALLGDSSRKCNASFRLSNTNVTVANTLRRAILTLTPSVGFRTEPHNKSEVDIKINTTPLVNEMLSHRIGMIPVRVPSLIDFNPELYEFILDRKNVSNELMDVRASDFQVFMRNPENPLDTPVQLKTEDYFPPDPITNETVLITRLRPQWNPTAPKEHIYIRAKASISNGTENIRWSPVSQCSYEYTRDSDPEHRKAVFEAWLATNKKITDPTAMEAEQSERMGQYNREFETMEIQRCFIKNEKGEPSDFTFHLESIGTQSIIDIVKSGLAACEALVAKYQDMDSAQPESVQILIGDSRYPSLDITFRDEAHTLGNLLETFLVDSHIDGSSEPKLTYAAYKVPHPLRKEMCLRVSIAGSHDPEAQRQTARLAIAMVCRHLKALFHAMLVAWIPPSPEELATAPTLPPPAPAAPVPAAPAPAAPVPAAPVDNSLLGALPAAE